MDHLQIIRDIGMKKFKPVYMLAGLEPYFIDLIADYVEENVLEESERAFGQTILYGRDVSMDQVLSLAKSFPMGGNMQVIIVKESQEMKDWKRQDDMKSFEHYLSHPTPTTLLVFTYKNKAFDKRTKISKLIEKSGVLFTSEKVRDYKMADWITGYAKEKGYRLEPSSANLLAEFLGNDLGKVINAFNKLAIIVPKDVPITPQHIEENIGISKDYNVWELQRALGEKDVLKANRIIDYFRSNPKANPIQMIIPNLHSYFMRLAAYQTLENKANAQKELELNPMAVTELRSVEKRYTPQKVERIISYLREADRKSKGVGNAYTEDDDLMKELVFKILH